MANNEELNNGVLQIDEPCCIANTGCFFDGCLDDVVGECIFVDKVYDAATFNLQGLQAGNRVPFGTLPTSRCGPKSRIIRVRGLRAKKFFNPDNINDPRNLTITPTTTLSGAQFVTEANGDPVVVPGPAGLLQYLIYADTSECDEITRGTPIFGSQEILITGTVAVELDVDFIDNQGNTQSTTLRGRVPVNQTVTNFFELCMPSVFDSAFLPQFTEFCNISFAPRLATQSISRDIIFNPATGEVLVNLIIALCITCEKKIKVPVQLCVLSTGFCEQNVSPRQICPDFPPLFPPQVNIPFIELREGETY
ncbi:hypothetical protein [Alkaliphilus oremlandii]|uniref:Uncharacterized protein n=1 Tax=Alkaliphilus oremlandii (strain OhILAs) TaxID=350688 RepID=A8MGK6_ALKOO|nr:hypothetical protein [Alkaliphilus oremlandii]ABW19229.1 hypothetical protein Clos_1689 [Alkaliphilus oremlandii OhILAs]